jgi:hypothetical protein
VRTLTNAYISYQFLFTESFHSPSHSIRNVEYHKNCYCPQTQFIRIHSNLGQFWDSWSYPVISSPKLFSSFAVLSWLLSELLKLSSPGIEPTDIFRGCDICFRNLLFETKNWPWRCSFVALSFRAAGTGFSATRTQGFFFRSFDLPLFPMWYQGIRMPNLVQIYLSVLELEVNIHTYIHTGCTHIYIHTYVHTYMRA